MAVARATARRARRQQRRRSAGARCLRPLLLPPLLRSSPRRHAPPPVPPIPRPPLRPHPTRTSAPTTISTSHREVRAARAAAERAAAAAAAAGGGAAVAHVAASRSLPHPPEAQRHSGLRAGPCVPSLVAQPQGSRALHGTCGWALAAAVRWRRLLPPRPRCCRRRSDASSLP